MLFIFFYFETKTEPDTRLFVPYYCVVERVCSDCKMILFEKDKCGDVKDGDDTIDNFCKFMFSSAELFVWVVHNGSRWLFEKKRSNPFTIMSGSKIMVLRFGKITIIDSYFFFFNTKLADLPHCMSIKDDVMEKGFHPYFFTDLSYVGAIVDG